MSDQNDMLKLLYDNNKRLKQTETREVPGNVPGYSQFYDTGTYVPTYLGGTTPGVTTYTTQVGSWTRIGRAAIVQGAIVWTAATGTGNVNVSLPFTSANVTNQIFSGSLWLSGVTFANNTPMMILNPNAALFLMSSPLTNAAPTQVAIEAAGTIIFTVTYFVA